MFLLFHKFTLQLKEIFDFGEQIFVCFSLTELILDQNDLSDIPMLDELAKLRSLSAARNNLANDCFFIRKGMKSDNNVSISKPLDRKVKTVCTCSKWFQKMPIFYYLARMDSVVLV